MEDKKIICANCKEEFIFTANEQQFYAERGYSDPKKCKKCRDEAKKARQNNGFRGNYKSYNDNRNA